MNLKMSKPSINIFWFRRDLRLHDNLGLSVSLKENKPVLPIFIFDTEILKKLPNNDARVTFIHDSLMKLKKELIEKYNSSIALYHGKPEDIFKKIIKKFNVSKVYTNHDFEPYAIKRDSKIKELLNSNNIQFNTFKDHVIFEKNEVVKADGSPYLVYTPYMKKWKERFKEIKLKSHDSNDNFIKDIDFPSLSLADIGFIKSLITLKKYSITPTLVQNYESTRNFPALDATSYLSPYLRFGLLSIREIVTKILKYNNETFLNELIWREFFMQILWHFPNTKNESFKKKYDRIEWRNNENEFNSWCEGKTGYPLVDAGMRQLNKTGYMHNRVRMVVGSFLCKHLLIDWRWGEAYFAEKLLDYEMSSNIGNWQWVAGCGVDAAPYFRIFNPTEQVKKFDKKLEYINTWVDDYNELSYPNKIVDHKEARQRCLETYKKALNQ